MDIVRTKNPDDEVDLSTCGVNDVTSFPVSKDDGIMRKRS